MTITENINEVILRWPSRYPQTPNIWWSNSTERDRLYSNSSYCDCQTNPCLLLFPWSCVLAWGLQNHIKGASSIKAASEETPKSSKPRRLTGSDCHVETCPQILPCVFQEHASDCLLPAKLPLDCGIVPGGTKWRCGWMPHLCLPWPSVSFLLTFISRSDWQARRQKTQVKNHSF